MVMFGGFAVNVRLYLQPVLLGTVFFITAITLYAIMWNLIIAYGVFPSNPISSSGMITVTTFVLTTSTFVTNQSTTTESSTTRISNETATTVLNETVTGTMCPNHATSCTGTGESVAVVVNRPIILIGDLRIGNIPVFDTALSPPDLAFYHNTYYSAAALICAMYAVYGVLNGRKKMKLGTQRRLQS